MLYNNKCNNNTSYSRRLLLHIFLFPFYAAEILDPFRDFLDGAAQNFDGRDHISLGDISWFVVQKFFEQVGWNPHLRRDRGKSPSEIMNGEIYSEFIDHPKPGIIDIPDPDGELLSQKNMNGFSVSVFRSL